MLSFISQRRLPVSLLKHFHMPNSVKRQTLTIVRQQQYHQTSICMTCCRILLMLAPFSQFKFNSFDSVTRLTLFLAHSIAYIHVWSAYFEYMCIVPIWSRDTSLFPSGNHFQCFALLRVPHRHTIALVFICYTLRSLYCRKRFICIHEDTQQTPCSSSHIPFECQCKWAFVHIYEYGAMVSIDCVVLLRGVCMIRKFLSQRSDICLAYRTELRYTIYDYIDTNLHIFSELFHLTHPFISYPFQFIIHILLFSLCLCKTPKSPSFSQ